MMPGESLLNKALTGCALGHGIQLAHSRTTMPEEVDGLPKPQGPGAGASTEGGVLFIRLVGTLCCGTSHGLPTTPSLRRFQCLALMVVFASAHQRQPLPDAPMAMDQLVDSGVYPKTIAERIEFNNTCVPHPITNRHRLCHSSATRTRTRTHDERGPHAWAGVMRTQHARRVQQ